MARYSRKFVDTRFQQWADESGLSTDCWHKVNGHNKSHVGAVYLDHNAVYGGYQIHQMQNEAGGIRCIGGSGRMKASELLAFFEGARRAKELRSE